MKIYWKYFGLIFSISLLFFGSSNLVLAKSYDIYVDSDNSKSEKGTKDYPYKTIQKAIDESSNGDEIYIENGEYKGDILINKEVSLFGESVADVIIDGKIEIKKETEAQQFTVDGNIEIAGGADATLDNLVVKEASGTGVNISAGDGKVIIKNSVIKKSGTRGLYVDKGSNITISNCNIYGNKGEGIELRNEVTGTITGNNIYENGGHGLKFFVASSSLEIKTNNIKNNGSSGIIAQYSKDSDKKGSITATNNTVSANDNFGFDCDGSSSSDYWTKSIKIDNNNLKTNGDGEINKECGLVQAAQVAQEEKQNAERQKNLTEAEKEKEVQTQIAEQNKQKTIQENEVELNKLLASKKALKEQVVIEQEKISKRGAFLTFLIGPNYKAINNIKEVAPGFGEHLSSFDDLDRKIIEDKNHQVIEDEINDITNFVEEVNALIVEKSSKFSLFGWFFRILN